MKISKVFIYHQLTFWYIVMEILKANSQEELDWLIDFIDDYEYKLYSSLMNPNSTLIHTEDGWHQLP